MRFILSLALGVLLGGTALYWLYRIGIRGVVAALLSIATTVFGVFLIWYLFFY